MKTPPAQSRPSLGRTASLSAMLLIPALILFIAGCQTAPPAPPEASPEEIGPSGDSSEQQDLVPGTDLGPTDQQTREHLSSIFKPSEPPVLRFDPQESRIHLIFSGKPREDLADRESPLTESDLFWEYDITQEFQGVRFSLQQVGRSLAYHDPRDGISIIPYPIPDPPVQGSFISGYLPDQPLSMDIRLRVAPFTDEQGRPYPALMSWNLQNITMETLEDPADPASPGQSPEHTTEQSPMTGAGSPSDPGVPAMILPDSQALRDLRDFPDLLPREGAEEIPRSRLSLNPPRILEPRQTVTLAQLRSEFQQLPQEIPPSFTLPGIRDGVFPYEMRLQDATGAFPPRTAHRTIFISQSHSTQYGRGLSLPPRASVLPETRLVSLPVLGARSYKLFASPVDQVNRSQDGFPAASDPNLPLQESGIREVPPVQTSPVPEFLLPFDARAREYQVVFAAETDGQALLEIPITLEPLETPPRLVEVATPDFTGQVFAREMTAATAAALLNNLHRQGFIRRSASNSTLFEESRNGSSILGLSLLDYGRQFSLEFSGDFSAPPGREDHPAVGISFTGARLLGWAYSMLAEPAGLMQQFPRTWWDPLAYLAQSDSQDPLFGVFRLPSQVEWSAVSQTPRGFSPNQESANYFRSFDPFEDPNPPFQRNGGPTSPVGFFPADTIFGLYDTRGNVWEWARDLVTQEDRPDLFRGPVSRQPRYRRVLGGAWNTPLEEYGPRGTLVPLGWFGEDSTSYSIGLRLFSAGDPIGQSEGGEASESP